MDIPEGWEPPTHEQIDVARGKACDALQHPAASELLARYYDPSGAYAGSTFLDIEPRTQNEVTPTDLFATSLLDVKITARGTRSVLSKETSAVVTGCLEQINIELDLADATPVALNAAETLHLTIRAALGKNPWVTTSKLCARKRPRFFPVRDRVVTRDLLGLGKYYRDDWQVMGALMGDLDLMGELSKVSATAERSGGHTITDPPLKVLDALLWMTSARSGRQVDEA